MDVTEINVVMEEKIHSIMKTNLYVYLFSFILFVSCNQKKEGPLYPSLEINNINISFGKCKIGEVKEFELEFTNSSQEILVINDIQLGCECLDYDFKFQPILANEKRTFKLFFKPLKKGILNNTIVINSNIKEVFSKINVKAEVYE